MQDPNPPKDTHPLNLALEIFRHRREHHPLGANYAVRLRLGHAEIQDVTALADVLSALDELGYRVVKKSGTATG